MVHRLNLKCSDRAILAERRSQKKKEARFTQLEGQPGPRPLRSHDQLYGLEELRPREYRQLALGSSFFLQTCLVMAYHIIYGGLFIGEHPAPPRDLLRPTIWRVTIIQLMLKHPDVDLHVLPQWLWGAGAIKPTGLITIRMPSFKKNMYDHQKADAIRPSAPIIGRFQDGSFKTSEHKEYPSAFCRALAASTLHQLKHAHRNGSCIERTVELPADATEWLRFAAKASTDIRAEASWLPDYQG